MLFDDDIVDFYEDMYKDGLREFRYSVESTVENDEGTQATLTVSYSNIDLAVLFTKVGYSIGLEIGSQGAKISLSRAQRIFDNELDLAKDGERQENTVEVVIVQDGG